MLWAQLILLAVFLFMILANVCDAKKEGITLSCVAIGVFVLSYFAGAFSEVVAWPK